MMGQLLEKVRQAWADLWVDRIECPVCKKQVDAGKQWGRFTVYDCGSCGKTTKAKCYD